MMSTFAQSPLYNVIKSRPGAIEAIKAVGDLMQKKGRSAFPLSFFRPFSFLVTLADCTQFPGFRDRRDCAPE